MKYTALKDIKVATDNPIQPVVKLVKEGQEFVGIEDRQHLYNVLKDAFSTFGALYQLDGAWEQFNYFFKEEYEPKDEERKVPMYKIEMYILDPNYDNSLEDIQSIIDQYLEDILVKFGDCRKKYFVYKQAEDFDESKWNKNSTPIEEYRKEFE